MRRQAMIGAAAFAVVTGLWWWIVRTRDAHAFHAYVVDQCPGDPEPTTKAACDALHQKRATDTTRQLQDAHDKQEADQAAQRDARQRAFAVMTADDRRERVHTCAIVPDTCAKDELIDLFASAKSVQESANLAAIADGARAEAMADMGRDGPTISPAAFRTAALLPTLSDTAMSAMPQTTLGKARKDPSTERGRVASTSGTILQIKASGDNFVGTISTNTGSIVYFITPFATDGLEDGSHVSLRGIFVQEYDYANVSGGETQSLVFVGKLTR